MKKLFFIFFIATLACSRVFSQGVVQINCSEEDEKINQIRATGLSDILSFQTMNQGLSNVTMTTQIGNWNKSVVTQQYDGGSNLANQVYSLQKGSDNEMTIGQIGEGNLLLGFQLGYVATEIDPKEKIKYPQNMVDCCVTDGGDQSFVQGVGNALNVIQQGDKNAVVAVQQGSENSIDVSQIGSNNYLVVYQKGNNNEIAGFRQENHAEKALAETIIQEGDGLVLNSLEASKSKPNGNSFIQKGINLSIELNNQFTNTLGGIEVTQSGKDMKVVIDQSFFPSLTR